jgi:deoxyribodipyrimidine photolyase-related protein
MNELLIVLGDQLFPPEFYSPYMRTPVFMCEDVGLCTHYKYHKHKIIFFLTSMRNFADDLIRQGFEVNYEKLSDKNYFERLQVYIKKKKIEKIIIGEVQDKFFEKMIFEFVQKNRLQLKVIPTPMFLCSREEFSTYLKSTTKPFMKTFYEKERKRLKILVNNDSSPVGGQWSFDTENRKKPPKILTHKNPPILQKTIHEKKVKLIVDQHFPDHPGSSDNFWAPVSRESALIYLKHFLKHHLHEFGAYQDALTSRTPFLYHSLLSPMINSGLLTPKEVIKETLKVLSKDADIPLSSAEGFIRQVMGWREFVRGIYQNFSDIEEEKNFFSHHRKLTDDWYRGTTGIPPVDDAIKKANEFAYCHHIERLMVLSNIMLLCEIHPHEVHRWFMEMFIDSADWVMGPNVYGMGQFSDGGIFATKPYISGSNYILKMSDYKKGEWCDVWDGLFWRFIGKHADFFSKNYRMNMMVKTFEKMDSKKKTKLLAHAEEFIKAKTL